jgi:hypothetical protein
MLPVGEFYSSNRSTCRRCIVERNAERRKADPEATKAKRRAAAARDRFRAEIGTLALGSVLDGATTLFAQVDAGDLSPHDARSELFDVAAKAIRDAEDRFGVEPGDGLSVLQHRKFLGITGIPVSK